MDAREVRKLATIALDATMPTRSGRATWSLATDQVVWVFALDRAAPWSRWGLIVGVKLTDQERPLGIPPVNACDVVIDYAFLGDGVPPDSTQSRLDDHKSYFTMVFDHTHDLISSEERASAFEFMAGDLVRIAETHSTQAQVRDAVRREFFRSGFINRRLLE